MKEVEVIHTGWLAYEGKYRRPELLPAMRIAWDRTKPFLPQWGVRVGAGEASFQELMVSCYLQGVTDALSGATTRDSAP